MKHTIVFFLLALSLLAAGCRPSTEEIATMTLSAWTPTPLPTATPTPLPIDLTITVTNEAGNPIVGANIGFPASDSQKLFQTDESGKVTWSNLPGTLGSLTVSAPGYTQSEQTTELVPGPNELSVTLTRAPFGLTTAEACAPGESLLFAQDFQSEQVSNVDTYPPGTVVNIVSDSDTPDDKVLALDFGATDGSYMFKAGPFETNVVRRFWYRPGDHSRFNFAWSGGESNMSADLFVLNDYSTGTGVELGKGVPVMQQGIWHLLEINTTGNNIEIWVDGVLNLTAKGVISGGGSDINFGSAFLPPDSIVHIDDVSICELNAPFTSLYTAPQ